MSTLLIDNFYRLSATKVLGSRSICMLVEASCDIRGNPRIERVVGAEDYVDLPDHYIRAKVPSIRHILCNSAKHVLSVTESYYKNSAELSYPLPCNRSYALQKGHISVSMLFKFDQGCCSSHHSGLDESPAVHSLFFGGFHVTSSFLNPSPSDESSGSISSAVNSRMLRRLRSSSIIVPLLYFCFSDVTINIDRRHTTTVYLENCQVEVSG